MTRISRFSTILATTAVLAAAAVLLMVVGMNRGAPSGDLAHAADPGAEVEAEGVQAAGGLTTKAIDLPAVQAHCRSQTGQHYDDCVTVNQVLDALARDCADCSDLTYIYSTTTGRVIKIKLQRKGLKGHIPAEIGSLEMLEELWLYTNELSGTSEAFELFVDVTTIQAPSYDLYQLMLDYSAPPVLLERFRDVFVHGVDNRDFFEWKVTANGMISPSGG